MARVYGTRGQPGFAVSLGPREITAFRDRWPASGLSGLRRARFEFASNGDLVDANCNTKFGSCERFDGPALKALSEDAQCLGEKRLKIPDGRCATGTFKGSRRRR